MKAQLGKEGKTKKKQRLEKRDGANDGPTIFGVATPHKNNKHIKTKQKP